MYLAPDGTVEACCWTGQIWGRTGDGPHRDSLRTIWDGLDRERQRVAVEAGDFSHGCQECAAATLAGNDAWSGARIFDPFGTREPADWPERMHFALSNTCNLMCVMCNGSLSSAIRAKREHRPPMAPVYGEAFFAELAEFVPHLRAAIFTGGEPFLCRPTRRVWDLMLELGVPDEVEVTTNATVWSDRLARYVCELEVDVTVSIDGLTAETNEATRVGVDHAAMLRNVAAMRREMEPFGGRLSINFCLMTHNCHELGDLLLWADGIDGQVQVSTVTRPPHLSLFRQPYAEVAAKVRLLDAQDATMRARLGRNLGVWEGELARLHRQLDALRDDAGQPVFLRSAVEGKVAEARAELASWAAAEPLVVELVHEVIGRLDVPAWASWCDQDRLVGADGSELMTAFADALGPLHDLVTTQPAVDVSEYRVRFGEGSGASEVRGVRLESADADGNRRDVVLVALRHGG